MDLFRRVQHLNQKNTIAGDNLMPNVALASINSFASQAMQADFVPPSEEAAFILSASQLSALISQAIEKAIQPLQDRISSLEDRIECLEKENAALDIRLVSLENMEEQDITRVFLDIAQDRQRISKLEWIEPQPMQKDRGEILRALLVANGGKMLAKDARQKMHLSRSLFSMLLTTMRDDVEVRTYQLKKNQKLLVLR
jgi:hypothetical protein